MPLIVNYSATSLSCSQMTPHLHLPFDHGPSPTLLHILMATFISLPHKTTLALSPFYISWPLGRACSSMVDSRTCCLLLRGTFSGQKEYKVALKEAKPYAPGTNIKGSPTLHATTPHPDKLDISENTRNIIYHQPHTQNKHKSNIIYHQPHTQNKHKSSKQQTVWNPGCPNTTCLNSDSPTQPSCLAESWERKLLVGHETIKTSIKTDNSNRVKWTADKSNRNRDSIGARE